MGYCRKEEDCFMTEIIFSFDTEDFTCDHSSDAVRDEAAILHEYGIRGNFNIVGYLAREFVRNRRTDVLDELKNHVISFHSLGHSVHPTICEYTDLDDYDAARSIFMKEELEGIGMVKAATGADSFAGACPPGDSLSYVAMYGYAELGIPLYLGSFFGTDDGSCVWFCNGFHTNYDVTLEGNLFDEAFDPHAFLDSFAGMKRVIIYNHPNMVSHYTFWDMANYNGENKHEMFDWEEPERRTEAEIALYYRHLRELIEAIQADDRFVISDAGRLAEYAIEKSYRKVLRSDIPEIRRMLKDSFRYISGTYSLSVCDIFYAAKHFIMTDDDEFVCGPSHGFLYAPDGCDTDTVLTPFEIKSALACCDPEKFIPASFVVDEKKFGPADLLFAMLDYLCDGGSEIKISPREQLSDFSEFENLVDIRLEDSWIHSKEFRDNYLSDRLRLQAWTLRKE